MEKLIFLVYAFIFGCGYNFSYRLYARGEARDALWLQLGCSFLLFLVTLVVNFWIILPVTAIVCLVFLLYKIYEHTPHGYLPEDERKLALAVRKKYCKVFMFSVLLWLVIYVINVFFPIH